MNTLLTLTFAGLLSIAPSATAARTNDVTGNWNGTLAVGSVRLRVEFKISKAPNNELTAKMDSIDQGARDIPVESVTLKGNVLRMEAKSINGVYEGTLDTAGTKAAGQWRQGQQVLPLTLVKGPGTNATNAVENLSPAVLAANKLAAQKLVGVWNGLLTAGAKSLRLRVNIAKTAAGTASGTMDSLDQGAKGIPLSAITLQTNQVSFEARGIGGAYEGTLAADGSSLAGQWHQGGQALPLEFTKSPAK